MNATRWATVCETVRPVVSDRCLSCVCLSVVSCLSATLVYCGRIKMKLVMQVGLGPGHIVLDGDPDPPQKGDTASNFQRMSIVAKRLDASGYHAVQR